MTDWIFHPWQSWYRYMSLEEALAAIADGTANEGFEWWATNDRVAAALEQFGRTRPTLQPSPLSHRLGR